MAHHFSSRLRFTRRTGVLKNAQNDEITICGSRMGLDEFVHGVRNVMNKSNVEVNLEIRANIHDTFHDFEYLDLTIHGCRLT